MPEIPGVTVLRGNGEPGLDLRLHAQHPSPLLTEADHMAKLEKPSQNMAKRLPTMGPSASNGC